MKETVPSPLESKERQEYPVEVVVYKTPEQVNAGAAKRVIEQVRKKPDSVFTLPTGATPQGMYDLLVRAYQKGAVDFRRIKIFNLDEYWPIQRENAASYASYMRRHFVEPVGIPLESWHIPDGEAADPQKECERYEQLLKRYGPVDLAVLGIGSALTCHIGFNERGSTLDSRTRYMKLDEETQRANAPFFDDPDHVPKGALTQGIANILEAKAIILIAKGRGKAEGVRRTLRGDIGPESPASFLRYHPHVTVILDVAAASGLDKK